jgi:hypothetical protein
MAQKGKPAGRSGVRPPDAGRPEPAPQAASGKPPQNPPAPEESARKSSGDDFFSFIEIPLKAWWPFIRSDLKGYYLSLLKLNLLRILFLVLAVAAGALALYGEFALLGDYLSAAGFWASFAVTLLVVLLLMIICSWLDRTFDSAAIALTARRVEGQGFSMRGSLWQLKGPSFRFALLDIAFRLILALPGVILLGAAVAAALSSPSGVPFPLFLPLLLAAYLLFWIYMVVAGIAYIFVLQFWMFGFVMEGRGVMESFHRSVALVRSRLLETMAFDFVVMLLFIASSLPLFALWGMAYLGLILSQFLILAAPSWGLPLFLACLLLFMALAVLLKTFSEAVWRPAHYLFWRKIAGKGKK